MKYTYRGIVINGLEIEEPCVQNHFRYTVISPDGRLHRFYTFTEALHYCQENGPGEAPAVNSAPVDILENTKTWGKDAGDDPEDDESPLFGDENYGETMVSSNGDLYLSY